MYLCPYGAFTPTTNAICRVLFCSLLFFCALGEANAVPDQGRKKNKKKRVCSQVIRTNVLKPRRRILTGGPTDLVFLRQLNSRRIPVHSSVSIVQCGGFI